MGAPVIAVENLAKRYKKVEAVKGVSFAVREGEIFGFLGPNGTGKTTTINMLCTLARPTSGRASVDGYDVTRQPSHVRRSIGLVFQETTLDDYLPAEQNLRFHAYAYGVPRATLEGRMKELMTMVELWDRRRDKVDKYSGGMKRRLEVVRGLLHRPRVLFLDEPTLGLDPQSRRRVWQYIQEVRRQETLTIFLTTHYMDEAEVCDRIAVIDGGEIIALDTPDALKDALGGDIVTVVAEHNVAAARELEERYGLSPELRDETLTFSVPRGEEFLPDFVRGSSQRLLSVGVRRPTLDDVFLQLTGHAIRDPEQDS